MSVLDAQTAIGQETDASVLWLINRLNQTITQLKGFKDDLEDCYPAHTLRALVRHFESLSVQFEEYLDLHNHRYQAVLGRWLEWAGLMAEISAVAHSLALELEQYARTPESFSWVMTRRRLNDLQIVAVNLHTLCVEAIDQSDIWLHPDQGPGVVLELPPRVLPQAIVDTYESVDSWVQWLRTRPQLEIGHNVHLLHTISADLTTAANGMWSIHAQFALKRVSLADANRYYSAVSALEEAKAFLDGLESVGVGSRRHAQTLMSHLKQCCYRLEALRRQVEGQRLSYQALGAMT